MGVNEHNTALEKRVPSIHSAPFPPIRSTIEFIHMLRGVAAVIVMLFHYTDLLPAWGLRWFGNGYMGVDLFFIISGFIMVVSTAHLQGGWVDCKTFWIKRVIRIWPAYVLTSLIYVLLTRHGFHFFASEYNVRELLASWVFYPTQNNSPHFWDPPYAVGWTLNYEMYFYLLLGLSLLFYRARWRMLFGVFGISLIVLPLWLKGLISLNTSSSFQFHYNFYPLQYFNIATNPILWEFVMGLLIGRLYCAKHIATVQDGRFSERTIFWIRIACLLALLLVVCMYVVPHRGENTRVQRCGVPLALMVVCLALLDKLGQFNFRFPKWAMWLGTISFSLYLVHQIVRVALIKYWGLGQGILSFLVAVLFSIGVAAVFHQLFEVKLNRILLRLGHFKAD